MTGFSRGHGVLESAAGLIPFGHLGWGYRHRHELARRANEYLTDGLRQGQYVVYVGEGTRSALNRQLDSVRRRMPADVADAWVEVTPLDEFYVLQPGSDVVDPEASVMARVAATEHAVAQGFAGFRAVVDVTAVARTEAQREAFTLFEFLIDQHMARLPVSALCAYQLNELGPAAGKLVCLHPYVNTGSTPIRIYNGIGTDLAISGHLTPDSHDDVIDVLRLAWRRGGRSELSIDATAATSDLDAANLLLTRVDAAAARDGMTLTVWTSSADMTRLIDRLGLAHLRLGIAAVADPDPPPEQLHAQIAQLSNRLANAPSIEQAKGMLMQTFQLNDDAAFAILKKLSQDNNVVLRDVAARVVSAWLSEGPRPDIDAATEFLIGVRRELRDQPE
jgi:hypothetical protein